MVEIYLKYVETHDPPWNIIICHIYIYNHIGGVPPDFARWSKNLRHTNENKIPTSMQKIVQKSPNWVCSSPKKPGSPSRCFFQLRSDMPSCLYTSSWASRPRSAGWALKNIVVSSSKKAPKWRSSTIRCENDVDYPWLSSFYPICWTSPSCVIGDHGISPWIGSPPISFLSRRLSRNQFDCSISAFLAPLGAADHQNRCHRAPDSPKYGGFLK